MRPDEIDPVELGVLLSTLRPDHPLVAAARGGADVSAGRAEAATAQCDVQADIASAFRDRPAEPPGFGSGVSAMERQQAADSRALAEQARRELAAQAHAKLRESLADQTEARAEAADFDTRRHLEAEARAHDERAERAERRVAERNAGTPPRECIQPTPEQRELTAKLVAEAREHLADRELREQQRYLDVGLAHDADAVEEMSAT